MLMDDKPTEGRWSTPANMPSFTERLQDHIIARSSMGSGSGEAIKKTATNIYEKGTYVANGAYEKAS